MRHTALWFLKSQINEHDALSAQGYCLSPGTSAYQRIISKIPMHMTNRELIPSNKWEGSTVSSINCDVADALISSIKVLAALTWAEADRCGKVLWLGWRNASLGVARQ